MGELTVTGQTPQLRDSHGRFAKAEVSVSSPSQVNVKPELEKPVVSITVNNPIKKILYWLDEIRKKQTTTFAIKLSIPLIALPVLVFAVFQLGRGSVALPFVQVVAKVSPTPQISVSPTPVPYSRSGTLKAATGANGTKYVLALKNGENVLLQTGLIDLAKYLNKQVLVTGIYEKQGNLIRVMEIAQIETFNEIVVTTPTLAPAATPEASSAAELFESGLNL